MAIFSTYAQNIEPLSVILNRPSPGQIIFDCRQPNNAFDASEPLQDTLERFANSSKRTRKILKAIDQRIERTSWRKIGVAFCACAAMAIVGLL